MNGSVGLEQVRIIEGAPGVARSAKGPLVTSETVLVAPFPLRSTGTEANLQVRGVSPKALEVRNKIKIVEGTFFHAALMESIEARTASNVNAGLPFRKGT